MSYPDVLHRSELRFEERPSPVLTRLSASGRHVAVGLHHHRDLGHAAGRHPQEVRIECFFPADERSARTKAQEPRGEKLT